MVVLGKQCLCRVVKRAHGQESSRVARQKKGLKRRLLGEQSNRGGGVGYTGAAAAWAGRQAKRAGQGAGTRAGQCMNRGSAHKVGGECAGKEGRMRVCEVYKTCER